MDLYRTKYYGANFVHFTELLKRNENISLSVSAVTNYLETENIYSPRVTKAKRKRIRKELEQKKANARTKKEADAIQTNIVAVEDAHSRRPRCAYFGELLQMDATPYEWLFFVKYFSLKKASEFPFFSKGFSLPSAGIMHPCA